MLLGHLSTVLYLNYANNANRKGCLLVILASNFSPTTYFQYNQEPSSNLTSRLTVSTCQKSLSYLVYVIHFQILTDTKPTKKFIHKSNPRDSMRLYIDLVNKLEFIIQAHVGKCSFWVR